MVTRKLIFRLLLLSIVFTSCSDDPEPTVDPTPLSLEDDSYIVDKGESIAFDLYSNEDETEEEISELEIEITSLPSEGTLTLLDGTSLTLETIYTVSELNGLVYQSSDKTNITEVTTEYTATNSEGGSGTGIITITISLGDYESGLIISAEGAFGSKDGSVSYVGNDLSTDASNYIYEAVNEAQLGGLVQSIAFSDDNAYIILNDANSVVVVDRYTFETVGTINTGFANPRYMAIVGDKGYVTNWGADTFTENDDYLAVIDLTTNTLEASTISLSYGVEQIVASGDKLYVSHKGAWSSNNIISVIDTASNNAVTEIEVNDNPDEIIIDDAGNLIVLCEGNTLYNADWSVAGITTASISFINTSTNEVTNSITFPENENASLLSYENGAIYYYQGATGVVYEIDETSTALATSGIDVSSIYGMTVNDGNLYTVTYNFVDLSELIVYNATSGASVYTSELGLGASKIYFN